MWTTSVTLTDRMGRPDEALQCFTEALDVARSIGYRFVEAILACQHRARSSVPRQLG